MQRLYRVRKIPPFSRNDLASYYVTRLSHVVTCETASTVVPVNPRFIADLPIVFGCRMRIGRALNGCGYAMNRGSTCETASLQWIVQQSFRPTGRNLARESLTKQSILLHSMFLRVMPIPNAASSTACGSRASYRGSRGFPAPGARDSDA